MAKLIELEEFIYINKLQKKDLAEYLGVSSSMITQYLSGHRPLSAKKIEQILEHPTWNKAPFLADKNGAEEVANSEVVEEIKEKIEDVESFLIVPEVVNAEPNANIEEVIEEDGTELEAISPNLLLSDMKVSVAEQIKGTSMLPTFQPNDWVFIRFLKDTMKIVSGKTYYLKCCNRPTMIRRVKFEGEDKLRLIAKNSEYDDIVICRSDIINIGNVVALFRMTFGDQYSELEELRREKEAEREKKDAQMDKMLEMMDKQSEQQNKLIDFITKTK